MLQADITRLIVGSYIYPLWRLRQARVAALSEFEVSPDLQPHMYLCVGIRFGKPRSDFHLSSSFASLFEILLFP